MFSNKNPNSNSLFLKKFKTDIEKFFKIKSSDSFNTQTPINQKIEDMNLSKASNLIKNNSPLSFYYSSADAEQPNFKRNNVVPSTGNKLNMKIPGTKPLTGNRTSRLPESSKQQVVSITYEEIGLFPRSFNRVFDRFFKQLFFDVENLVIQEYRFYRYLFLTTVKCVFILLFVPLTINFVAKNYLVRPITEYYWNTHQPEIFLNSYQQKKAFTELQDFEEKIYFESLILPAPSQSTSVNIAAKNTSENLSQNLEMYSIENSSNSSLKTVHNKKTEKNSVPNPLLDNTSLNGIVNVNPLEEFQGFAVQTPVQIPSLRLQSPYATELFSESVQNRLHEKIVELAVHYNEESIEAITNFFADLISFSSLCYLFFALEIQINITKSFLLEVFFGLDDSKKSLFILFLTDLLVGYHSPNIWELFFSSLFDHYGLPESQTTIFLLVATLPVLLDVLFKYLIFRHLNRASPATVATYHAMIE